MPWGFAAASVGGALVGGIISGNAAENAAQTQANAANQATQVEQQQFQQTQSNLQPYMQQGTMALGDINSLMANPSMVAQLPGYQFQLQQGTDAIQNSAAAGGLTGNTLKALSNYGQGTASSYYNNYWNQLMQMANLGQTSAAGVGNIGASTANSIGGNIIGAGNALAAGQVGSASAINTGISGGIQNYLLAQALQQNSLTTGPGSSIYTDPSSYFAQNGSDTGGGIFSDVRLKTDVRRVGTTDAGLPIYTYRYVWGGPVQMGVLAQEAAQLAPDAVGTRDGWLTVDYSKVQ